MNHPDPFAIEELAAGVLPDEEVEPLVAHLQRCPACRTRLEAEATLAGPLARVAEGIRPAPRLRLLRRRAATLAAPLALAAAVLLALASRPVPYADSSLQAASSLRGPVALVGDPARVALHPATATPWRIAPRVRVRAAREGTPPRPLPVRETRYDRATGAVLVEVDTSGLEPGAWRIEAAASPWWRPEPGPEAWLVAGTLELARP